MNETSSIIRHAAKLRTLAIALGLKPTRDQLRLLQEWQAWPGFPRKVRSGWPIEAVRDWLRENAGKITEQKALAAIASPRGKVSRHDLNALFPPAAREEAHPNGGNGADTAPLQPANNLGKCNTQAALARMLGIHYAGRITIDISENAVKDWKKGVKLPDGVPPLPAKIGNYFDGDLCARWFDQHLLPVYAIESDPGQDLFGARDLALLRKRDEQQDYIHRQWLRDKERGDFQRAIEDECLREFTGLLRQYHGFVRTVLETRSQDARRQKWTELMLPPEQQAALAEFELNLARRELDEIETHCAEAAAEMTAEKI